MVLLSVCVNKIDASFKIIDLKRALARNLFDKKHFWNNFF